MSIEVINISVLLCGRTITFSYNEIALVIELETSYDQKVTLSWCFHESKTFISTALSTSKVGIQIKFLMSLSS